MPKNFWLTQKGQFGGMNLLGTMAILALSIYILVVMWQTGSVNCLATPNNAVCTTGAGLYSTVVGTFLPLLVLGTVAYFLIRLF